MMMETKGVYVCMENYQPEQVTRQGEVPTAVNVLLENLEQTAKEADALVHCIESVLHPEPSTKKEKSYFPSDSDVPLVARLHEMNGKLSLIRTQLRDTRERLEL